MNSEFFFNEVVYKVVGLIAIFCLGALFGAFFTALAKIKVSLKMMEYVDSDEFKKKREVFEDLDRKN